MLKLQKILIENLNDFLKKRKNLTKILIHLFDFASKFTHFFLFNVIGFTTLMLLLFIIPVANSQEFIKFLIGIIDDPLHFGHHFNFLPIDLKILLSFYFFLIEIVFLCTLLSFLPKIKAGMIEKYKDNLIIKKRGYNMWSSSIRRATTTGIPLTAAIIVTGDVTQHYNAIEAIKDHNKNVWDAYRETKDKSILSKLQSIPTYRISEKIHQASVKFYDTVITWSYGSKTKD